MTTEKQQTPLSKLIARLNKRIEEVDPLFAIVYVQAKNEVESLLPEEKQMVIDAINRSNLRELGEVNQELGWKYFNETYQQ
jgi:hypothetical protein